MKSEGWGARGARGTLPCTVRTRAHCLVASGRGRSRGFEGQVDLVAVVVCRERAVSGRGGEMSNEEEGVAAECAHSMLQPPYITAKPFAQDPH